ncbi:MAG: patatin-like phospholipase family protein [Bdellovibrionales bacterium]
MLKNLEMIMQASKRMIWVGFCVALTVGCSMLERRATPQMPQRTVPTNDSDFDVRDRDNGEVADSSPLPKPARPKKVGVILGPGGAKALAQAGVLKELQRARVPIMDVIGLEWGSLVAGLFAQRGQANEMEWKLYKLEKQDMPSTGFLSSKLKAAEIAGLRDYLKDSFAQMDVQRTHISFSCPSQALQNADWQWAESGALAQAVENCLPYLPLYDVQKNRMAGAFAAAEAADRLRKRGAEVVVLVNVLNSGAILDPRQLQDSAASVILWQEIRRNLRAASLKVDDWIEVDTTKIGVNEFARRKELFATGEKAGQAAAKRLTDKYGF